MARRDEEVADALADAGIDGITQVLGRMRDRIYAGDSRSEAGASTKETRQAMRHNQGAFSALRWRDCLGSWLQNQILEDVCGSTA